MGHMECIKSFFADRACAENAVKMALPMIVESIKDSDVSGAGFLHIVIMNPACLPGNSTFEEAILYEHSIGDRDKWDANYAEFARAKARLAWRTGMDGHRVLELQPQLLIGNDFLGWGGVVVDGIVVGVSGAHPWFDEAFAGSIAMCVRALAKAAVRKNKDLFLK